MKFNKFGKLWILIPFIIVMGLYFFLVRRNISPDIASSLEMILFGSIALAAVISALVVLFTLAGIAFPKSRSDALEKLGDRSIFLAITIGFAVVFVAASQLAAYTPPILDKNGEPVPGSIAVMEQVELGGQKQWVIIRGEDTTKPVLLLLSGGPGASESARFLRFNQELEQHFVVVIWEQRGCAKSYPAHTPKADLTISQYVSDIVELTQYLQDRFDEDKIYLTGHSWGTIIGALAAEEYPELFHAYIGTAQMVDVRKADQIIYAAVLEHAVSTGDDAFVKTLKEQGEPPYFGKSPIQPYSTLFGREYSVFEYPNIKNEDFRRNGDALLMMLKQPEYGWLDRIYYLLGLMNTFNVVYPQLQDLDLREEAANFELPVYIILGRHDMNNPLPVPEEYFNLIEAPHKELIFFEDSGHGMIWEEADKFHSLLIDTIIPETYETQ
ncbi:MAG: alpha/beta hydrolase [Anaerolineae bacterium]|jgi:pimeloyl-ACP methyl ester carboxylesterase|nr:alpha/beta hydrolase [Anaerolineae bacterium]